MAKRHGARMGDLESLFVRLEELVLANSGEDEFEEVFKLVVAKLADETYGEARFMAYSTEVQTFDVINELLRTADSLWPGIILESRSSLRPEHLQVCVQAISKHSLRNSGLEVIDNFFEFLVSRGAKGAKGQYFTPRHVVEMCVRLIDPKPDEVVVDPACGSGGFLVHTLNYVRRNYLSDADSPKMREYCSDHLWGFDIDSRAVRVAKALMVLAGDGSANVIRLNSLLNPSAGDLFTASDTPTLMIEDIVRTRLKKRKGFDVILTNPPFAGEVRESALLNSYSLTRGKTREERDVLFVERCLDLLRPGGRLAIVLPHNKFAMTASAPLREHVLRRSHLRAVIGLGRNTFLPHTHQKAAVMVLQKLESGERSREDQPIFFAISERDGKSSKGQLELREGAAESDELWDRLDHDLGVVVDKYREFKS